MVTLREIVVAASAAGIVITTGLVVYRYYKGGKSPGIAPALVIPSLTGMLLYSLQDNPHPIEIARAGGLLPTLLR